MRTPIPGGLLVAIDGIDGAGKTTVAAQLAQWCGERGFSCVLSKEPTSMKYGMILRESAKSGRLSVEQEVELFLKDRVDHVHRSIGPALKENSIVILDRYYWSTAAYQGARGADFRKIIEENEAAVPAPDLILLLDVDEKSGIGRIKGRGDMPNDFEDGPSLCRAREIFLHLHERKNRASVLIDAADDLRSVFQKSLEHFKIAALNKIGKSPDWATKGALDSVLALFDEKPL